MARREFEQVVASAPRKEVKAISIGTSAAVAAGASLTYDFYAAPATVARILNMYCFWKSLTQSVTPATSGSHTLIINNTDGLGGAYVQFESAYNVDLKIEKLEATQATLNVMPSDKAAFARSIQGIYFDSVTGVRFTHKNDGNTLYTPTTARAIQFKYEEEMTAR